MINTVKKSINDFNSTIKLKIIYKLLFSIIFLLLITPFIYVFLNFLLPDGLSNMEIIRYYIKPRGIVILCIFFFVCLIYRELVNTGYSYLNYKAKKNKEVKSFYGVIFVLKNFKKICALALLKTLNHIFLLLPAGILVYHYIIINVRDKYISNIYVIFSINFIMAIICIIIGVLMILYLETLWAYTPQEIVVNKGENLIEMMISSSKVAKKRMKKTFVFGPGFYIFITSVFLLISYLIDYTINIDFKYIMYFMIVSLTIFNITILNIFEIFQNILLCNNYYELNSLSFNIENKKFKKKNILFFVIVVGIFSNILVYSFYNYEIRPSSKIYITAHRGYSKMASENTGKAVLKAIEENVDYIEIDVNATKDGVFVLSHDNNLKRLTGTDMNIWDSNFKDIQKLKIFNKDKISKFEDVLKIADKNTKFNFEIKFKGTKHVPKMLKIIKKYGYDKNSYVSSFNVDQIKKVDEIDKNIKIGYIIFASIGDLKNLDVDMYSVKVDFLTDNLVEKIKKQNKELHVWTVNKDVEVEKVINYEVDNIITDEVLKVKDKLKERGDIK